MIKCECSPEEVCCFLYICWNVIEEWFKELIGLPGMSCLWIFGSRYKCEVLALVSVVRNLYVALSIILDL